MICDECGRDYGVGVNSRVVCCLDFVVPVVRAFVVLETPMDVVPVRVGAPQLINVDMIL